MNGDGINNDLMYIYPSGSDINWASDPTGSAAAYDAFLAQDKYLRSHKGQYAEAYAARAPWSNRFDFRIAQDFAFKAAGQKHNFQVLVDFMNIGNMFNSKWGIWQTNSSSNGNRILTYKGKNAAGEPTFDMVKVDGAYCSKTYEYPGADEYSQCWNFQIGLRYLFN